MKPHLHKFNFESGDSAGHKHKIAGYTDNKVGINTFHFHFFYGISSYSSHTHYFSGVTGLPVKTENGHIHKLEGIFEQNNMHNHKFNGYTFEDVAYTPGKQAREREAFV